MSARKTPARRKKTTKSAANKKPARKKGGRSAPDTGVDNEVGSATTPARAKPGHISVRMYNNILGDCFLIRIPAGPERDVQILIDCGALQGMPSAADIMKEIADDIATTTGSRLDVLIVTHEHWDHLSGFCQAEDIFRKFEIDELWLAWTEDDKDADAARIRARRQKALQLLLTLDKHFGPAAAAPEEDEEEATRSPRAGGQRDEVRELLAFTGQSPGAAASRMDTGAILTMLKGLAKKVRYFTPGADPIPLPAGVPVQAYVLGPPKDPKFLLRSNPRKGEVYLTDESAGLGVYLAAAVQLEKEAISLDADEARAIELSMPFDNQHFRRLSEMKARQELQDQVYFLERDEWRRIDRDWLGAAEQLALKLDSDTNNTSLVLAFAFGSKSDPRVLLFPGDAQVGNWDSWQQYVWPSGAKREDPAAIDITKLFAATVLYKVGHHASHNATLRANGLELMTHPDLVAMIPVREEFARKTKHWNMPFPSLLARLLEKTKGKVLRADKSLADLHEDRLRRENKPGELSRDDWDAFFSRLSAGPKSAHSDDVPLYVEYSVPLA